MVKSSAPINLRTLIVNADDFGLSAGVNHGVIAAHRQGVVTSASLMVRWPAAPEAAALSRDCAPLSVGLHVDLGEWAFREGTWSALYDVVPLDDRVAVEGEVLRQLDRFRELMGRNPTHLDSHQHVHREEPARSILREIAAELAVPLRHFAPEVHYCGAFYGQTATGGPLPGVLSTTALIELLRELPPGCTELGCHPALDTDLDTMYRNERLIEVETLCDGRVRRAIEELGIDLRSFADFPLAVRDDRGEHFHSDVCVAESKR